MHCKSASYGTGFGNVTLVTLVNPYNVVAIPNNEFSKFRCCEYYPISKAELDDKNQLVEFEPGTYDIEYNGIESLATLLNTTSIDELQKNGDLSKDIVSDDFKFILDEAKKSISNRVIVVK